MTFRRKIFLWCAGMVLFILSLAAAAAVLAPVYLNAPSVKSRIEAELSRRLGGTITYRRLRVPLFPRPHIVVEKPRLSIPKELRGTLDAVAVYPQILPLFKGRVLVSGIRVHKPDLSVTVPETVVRRKAESLSLPEVKESTELVLGSLASFGPGLRVRVEDGSARVFRKGSLILSLRNLSARFNAPPGKIRLVLAADTGQWGPFSLSGTYTYDEQRSAVKDLSVALGRSSLSGLSGALIWREVPEFKIDSGRAVLVLDQIYPWLRASNIRVPVLREFRSLAGELVISSLTAKGPVARPSVWLVKVSGALRKLVCATDRLPAPFSADTAFVLTDHRLTLMHLSAALGNSSLSGADAWFERGAMHAFTVRGGTAAVDIGQVSQWSAKYPVLKRALKDVRSVSGTINLSSFRLNGPLTRPRRWQVALAGSLSGVGVDSQRLPGPVYALQGRFSLSGDELRFAALRLACLDARLDATGSLSNLRREITTVSVVLNGTLGRQSVDWLSSRYDFSATYRLRAPIELSTLRIVWRRSVSVSLDGTVTVAGGPVVSLDLTKTPGELAIRQGAIRDERTEAAFSMIDGAKDLDLSFAGTLEQATLGSLFSNLRFGNGSLRGDLRLDLRKDRPLTSTATGELQGDDIVVPWGPAVPGRIEDISLSAAGHVLTIRSLKAAWLGSRYTLSGIAAAGERGIVLNMDVAADRIDVAAVEGALSRPKERGEQAPRRTTPSYWKSALRGIIRVKASHVFFDKRDFHPVQAEAILSRDGVHLAFSDSAICGISLPGKLLFSSGRVSFVFNPHAAASPLDPSIACLSGENMHVTGTYDLKALLQSTGRSGELLSALEGGIDLRAKDGKIYKYPLLAKIFSVLSLTELLRGKVPELGGSGFPYHSLVMTAKVRNGKLELRKFIIDGSTLTVIAEGNVDLVSKKIDLVVLVAPFSTVNWIIRHIPLVGRLMGGTLISIPVKVSGTLADPDVTFLAPSAVGTRIVELLENIIRLPVDLVSPLLHRDTQQQK